MTVIKQKILISIIGAGKYSTTTYKYGNKITTVGEYSVCAIQQLFKPDQIFIAMTDMAHNAHYDSLKSILIFEEIRIKDGKDENEFWEIFQEISDKIPENSEMIIDVTTGFRSLPILLLSISVYLQVIKSVSVEHILYGAFDAKDENGHSPLIDLDPFLKLIEWSYATRNFLELGNGRLFSKLLDPIQKEAHIQKKAYIPQTLSPIGKSLINLTNAFSTIRTLSGQSERKTGITEIAASLVENIPKAFNDVENTPSAKPFKDLLEKIKTNYLSVACPADDIFKTKGLKAQAAIIQHYILTLQFQQAATLARELIVTIVCINENWDCINMRREAENLLNAPKDEVTEFDHDGLFFHNLQELKEKWVELIKYRNDLNHAGMNKQPISAPKLIKKIKPICLRISEIINSIN